MLGPLAPPARLAPLGEVGDDVCTQCVLWASGLGSWLAFQCDDIIVDECACTLPLQGQSQAFAIRCFKSDMRLKLGLVLFGDVDDQQPPQSTRRNTLPVKRIDGALLMGHEYLACALV